MGIDHSTPHQTHVLEGSFLQAWFSGYHRAARSRQRIDDYEIYSSCGARCSCYIRLTLRKQLTNSADASGEREVIDGLLEHGPVKHDNDPSPSDTFDRQPFPSPLPFSMPTIRTTAAPVTPLPQEKQVKEALTPASLRTPTSDLSPAPSPGRRRLPGWMSPGGAKIR